MTDVDPGPLGISDQDFLHALQSAVMKNHVSVSTMRDSKGEVYHLLCLLKPLNKGETVFDNIPIAKILTPKESKEFGKSIYPMETGSDNTS